MRAMVFAAGLGTRLRPLTDNCPKALVEVKGEPMLGHVMRRLVEAGVREVVVNVHHFPDMIIDYLNSRDNFGITVHISDERDCLLDTGGGLLAARRFLDCGDGEPVLVHNADIYTDVDFSAMIEAHKRLKATATLLVAERESSRALLFDHGMRMRGWLNNITRETRPPHIDTAGLDSLAFGGVHVVSTSIFDALQRFATEKKFSITDFYIAACGQERICGYVSPVPYVWGDIGSPAKLAAINQM